MARARALLPLAVLPLAAACSAGRLDLGTPDPSPRLGLTSGGGALADLHGAVTTSYGSQAALQGWVVAMIERDTQLARVAEVDAAGLYTLRRADLSRAQTLALLSPDYVLAAVLTVRQDAPAGTVRQFVRFDRTDLPALVVDGPRLSLADLRGVTIEKDLASDQDADGVPDGSASLGAALAGAPPVDTDLDGVPNAADPDIDGDGIINVLDPDDNGNAIPDVLDADADGDLVADAAGGRSDATFPEACAWVAVTIERSPHDVSLTFATKLADGTAPLAVQMRGAPSLLNGATTQASDGMLLAWNRLLADDGQGTRTARVLLAGERLPRANEAVFFQLARGTPENPWYEECPYVFGPVKPASLAAQLDEATRTVLVVDDPFGEAQDFAWVIQAHDAAGRVAWTSAEVPGSTRQAQIPRDALAASDAWSVTAVSRAKVPGRPALVVHSPRYTRP